MYRQLDSKKIIETAEKLFKRIGERFPQSGLSRVGGEVVQVARASAELSEHISRPYVFLRAVIVVFSLALIIPIGSVLSNLQFGPLASSVSDFVQALDAALEAIVLIGGGIVFMITLESRLRRKRALTALHELRSLAHVVDMHQLTKDPERLQNKGDSTTSSPERGLDRFQLARYLNYCSELLSVISKIAALYVQKLPDAVVLEAVNDIENLTNGLSRKIWQKIIILESTEKKTAPVSAS